MMKFFSGFFLKKPIRKKLPKPVNSSTLYLGSHPLYLSGCWRKHEVHELEKDRIKLLILGDCFASQQEILNKFNYANRNKDYTILTKLPGNYNIVVYRDGCLQLYSDLASLRPLFYVETDDFLIYSSNRLPLKQLLKLDVDLTGLACYLMAAGMVDLMQKQPLFQKIEEIPPCYFLNVTQVKSQLHLYWTDPEPLSLNESVKQFRKGLLLSVQKRIEHSQQNVVSDLSGGIDSSTLTIIAANHLKKQNKHLVSMTLDNESLQEVEDITIAKKVAKSLDNIKHIIIDNNKISLPYHNLDLSFLTDEPISFHCMLDKMYSLLEHAKMNAADVYINGEGGDAVLLVPYAYIVDLFRSGKIVKWLNHSYGWSRVQHNSPFQWLLQTIKFCSMSYDKWLKVQAENLRWGIDKKELFQWSNSPARAVWYSKDARKLVSKRLEEFAETGHSLSSSVGQHGTLMNIQLTGRIARSLQHINERDGVNTYFPYLDNHIIRTCLSTRLEDRITPYKFKPLIKLAFQKEMPRSLLNRTSKGEFTDDLFQGMKKNIGYVLDYFSKSLLAEMGLIDLDIFKREIEKFSRGIQIGLWELNITIAVECWLREVKKDNSMSYWDGSMIDGEIYHS